MPKDWAKKPLETVQLTDPVEGTGKEDVDGADEVGADDEVEGGDADFGEQRGPENVIGEFDVPDHF